MQNANTTLYHNVQTITRSGWETPKKILTIELLLKDCESGVFNSLNFKDLSHDDIT